MTGPAWDGVVEAFVRGGTGALPQLFRGMSDAERKALIPEIKRQAALARTDWLPPGHRSLLRITGVACLGGPAAVSQWIAHRELRAAEDSWTRAALVDVLADRRPDWIPEVVERLCARLGRSRETHDLWTVVDMLARRADLPVPVADTYVLGWFFTRTNSRFGDTLGQLHADPYTRELLPRLCDVDDLGRHIEVDERRWAHEPDQRFTYAAAKLVDAGFADRGQVIDRGLARFLRGTSARDMRGFVQLYAALDVSDAEMAARVGVYLRLLPDSSGRIAELAQGALRRVDATGGLTADQLEEASRAVLFRVEKKLVSGQLTWLAQAVKQHPEAAAPLVGTAVTALAHADPAVHERVLAFLSKQIPKLDESGRSAVLDRLKAAADGVQGPARRLVADLLGEPEPTRMADGPMPVWAPRELPSDKGMLPDMIEDLSVVLHAVLGTSGTVDPWQFERVVTMLLRESARDPAGLAEAVGDLADSTGVFRYTSGHANGPVDVGMAVRAMVTAAAGRGGERPGWFRSLFGKVSGPAALPKASIGPEQVIAARLYEVAQRLRTPLATPYLARPADARGYVDPEELVRGIEDFAAAGRTPWALDLEQALLRLPRDCDAALVARLRKLRTPAAGWAAEVMAVGGMPDPVVTDIEVRKLVPQWRQAVDGEYTLHRMPAIGPTPGLFAPGQLAAALCGVDRPGQVYTAVRWRRHMDIRCWPLIAPGNRDLIAAHAAVVLVRTADSSRGGTELLPLLAESDGRAGVGMAMALAYGLAARHPEDRVNAVDALVTLTARHDAWDPGLVGTFAAQLLDLGRIKLPRLVAGLRDSLGLGAAASVWPIAASLVHELRGKRPAGLGDLLAVAADAASRTAVRDHVPALDSYAGPGTSRIATEARRLQAMLR